MTVVDEIVEAASNIELEQLTYPDNAKPVLTAHAVLEWASIQDDPVLFCSKMRTLYPSSPFLLYDFQRELFSCLTNRLVVIRNARQMGLTTCLAAHVLWQITKKPYTRIICVSPSRSTATAFLETVYNLWRTLAPHLRPQIKRKMKTSIAFDEAEITVLPVSSLCQIRGVSIDSLYLMDAAFLAHKHSYHLMNDIYPCLSRSGSIIVQSSAGINSGLFYDIWTGAVSGQNKFLALDLPWYKHPKRTEAWATTISALIGEKAFENEYNCVFTKK